MTHWQLTLLSTALLGGAVATATADTITFYNTGVANDGSLLTAGTADSHYTLDYSADPNGTTAVATTPINWAWQQDTSTAGWISLGADGSQSWAGGYYIYETLLDLTGFDASTAALSGMIAADDNVYIYLNRGGSAVYSGGGFSSSNPFLINSGFTSGLNYVDFIVYNASNGPTGLMVDDTSATANTVTPEPGSLLLLASGTAFGIFAFRKGWLRTGSGLRPS